MSRRQSRSSISQKLSSSSNKQLAKQKSIKSNNSQNSKSAQNKQKLSNNSNKSNNNNNNNNSQPQQSHTSSSQQQQNIIMNQAIQKASCLIQLLTRDNTEYRQLIDDLQQQLAQQKQSHHKIKEDYQIVKQNANKLQQLEKQNKLLRQDNNLLTKQNQSYQIQLQKNRINTNDYLSITLLLNQTKQKNKLLHIKIADLTKSSAQLKTSLNSLQKQFLSLQNENQYLLKQLQKQSQKQNIYNTNITKKQSQFTNTLKSLDKTKQAFARRSHQLQQQNINLLITIDELNKQKYDLQIIAQQSMRTLDILTQKIQAYRLVDNKIQQIYQKIKLQQKQYNYTNNNSVKYQLKHPQQLSSNQRLYQIQLILNYRLQHVQQLLLQIITLLNKQQWKSSLYNLRQTQLIVQRVNDYLNQLSTTSIPTIN